MDSKKLNREQKEILIAILCQTNNAEQHLDDISARFDWDNDLSMLLETARFAMHTAKTRVIETLLESS